MKAISTCFTPFKKPSFYQLLQIKSAEKILSTDLANGGNLIIIEPTSLIK